MKEGKLEPLITKEVFEDNFKNGWSLERIADKINNLYKEKMKNTIVIDGIIYDRRKGEDIFFECKSEIEWLKYQQFFTLKDLSDCFRDYPFIMFCDRDIFCTCDITNAKEITPEEFKKQVNNRGFDFGLYEPMYNEIMSRAWLAWQSSTFSYDLSYDGADKAEATFIKWYNEKYGSDETR